MRVALDGGPHDGSEVRPGIGAAFLWTDGKRCYRSPGRGRALYRLMGQSSAGLKVFASRYRFVGNLYGLCACGAYRKRGDRCRLCGSGTLVA